MCTAQRFDEGTFDTSTQVQTSFANTCLAWTLGAGAPDVLNGQTGRRQHGAGTPDVARRSLFDAWQKLVRHVHIQYNSHTLADLSYNEAKQVAAECANVKRVFHAQLPHVTGPHRGKHSERDC
jgi:Adenosine-deaminase (editase) domain